MLQHLWTGPISNASVDVVQGSRSVEVRAVGVTKVNGCFFILHISDTALMSLACCRHILDLSTHFNTYLIRVLQLIVSWER